MRSHGRCGCLMVRRCRVLAVTVIAGRRRFPCVSHVGWWAGLPSDGGIPAFVDKPHYRRRVIGNQGKDSPPAIWPVDTEPPPMISA